MGAALPVFVLAHAVGAAAPAVVFAAVAFVVAEPAAVAFVAGVVPVAVVAAPAFVAFAERLAAAVLVVPAVAFEPAEWLVVAAEPVAVVGHAVAAVLVVAEPDFVAAPADVVDPFGHVGLAVVALVVLPGLAAAFAELGPAVVAFAVRVADLSAPVAAVVGLVVPVAPAHHY